MYFADSMKVDLDIAGNQTARRLGLGWGGKELAPWPRHSALVKTAILRRLLFGGHSIACENRRFSSLIVASHASVFRAWEATLSAAGGRFARRNVCYTKTEIPC